MNQPIAGVMPSDLAEVTCRVVWPTIGALSAGRLVGRLAAVRIGVGRFFTLGKLLTLASTPLAVAVFGWQLMPRVCRRYALTNRRIIVQLGLMAIDGPWVAWDDFDAIDIETLPGQEWLHAGDLVFRRGGLEVLRLPGVSRPETFRQACLGAQSASRSVAEIVHRQAGEAA